jgi:hypothetical protein
MHKLQTKKYTTTKQKDAQVLKTTIDMYYLYSEQVLKNCVKYYWIKLCTQHTTYLEYIWVKISLEYPNKPHCIDTTVTPRACPNGQKERNN